ncbi:macrolide family glycosyltransferase [Bacillus sp. C1]
MLNILMVNFPAEGHVNPTLGMVKAFTERGDNVHYITTEKFKDRLESFGATVHLHSDLIRKASIDTATPSGIEEFLNIHIQTSIDILKITKKLAETIHFDFVLYDKFGAGELVREYLNIPGISSSPSFLIPKKFFEQFLLNCNESAEKRLYQMNEEFGVLPKNMLQFMSNTGTLNIVYTSRYFQPNSSDFGEDNIFIGPSFPERKSYFPIEELQGKKVLYISMGTVLDRTEEFFNTCIDAFADFDGKVVIATGEKVDLTKLKQAPENIIISSYVPQLEILSQSDVFITHGGMNSVNEAIHFHVPLVVIPHDKDQPMVAKRLEELEAGYRLSKDNINPQSLREVVKEVLSNQKYKEGIQKINESFLACGGPEEALKRIDCMLKK